MKDWISIAFLLFYFTVFLIIFSLLKDVKYNSSQGYVHGPVPANTTVVINQQIPLQQPQPVYPPQQGYYPPPNQPPPYTQQPPYNTGY